MKYIDGTLKVKFELNTTSKPKPVAGPDDLLLMLVQHWARDESVFPTEDDRHDVATVMLFSSLIGIITLAIGLLRAIPEHRAGVICFVYFHVPGLSMCKGLTLARGRRDNSAK